MQKPIVFDILGQFVFDIVRERFLVFEAILSGRLAKTNWFYKTGGGGGQAAPL